MRAEILLAIDDKNWELEMGRAVSESNLIRIARRCVDLTEVFTMLEVGEYRAVILSSELAGLDLETVERIKSKNSLAIGIFNEIEIEKYDFMSELDFDAVLGFYPDDDSFINNLIYILNQDFSYQGAEKTPEQIPGLIAVWGSEGAPGRTSLAIDLATYLNRKSQNCLLIDADASAPAIGASLGISEEISGLSAAIHLAQKGKLAKDSLTDCLEFSRDNTPVLTGILRANRWMELRGSGFEKLLRIAARRFPFQVVDTNATLPDEKDSNYPEFDATHRFGHLLPLFSLAEEIIFVVKATPLGIIRAAEVLGNQNLLDLRKCTVIVNQFDDLNFKRDDRDLIYKVLQRFVNKNQIWFHQSHPNAYAQGWLKGSSGYSLIKGEIELTEYFESFVTQREIEFARQINRNSKNVA